MFLGPDLPIEAFYIEVFFLSEGGVFLVELQVLHHAMS